MKTAIRIAKVAPWDQGEVAIHGPSIYGASVNKPFLYTIPATAERPLTFSAEGLPEGLHLNPANGQISGAARNEGNSKVLFLRVAVIRERGSDRRESGSFGQTGHAFL